MKMTKILTAMTALVITSTMLPGYAAPEMVTAENAEERTEAAYENLTYEIQEDGTISITGCAEDAVSVVIPAEIEGKAVTNIGSKAFYNCTSLTEITIPDSVTSIWNGAFTDCSSLTSISIPDSVTRIASSAFSGCTGLTEVTIPDSVTEISMGVFAGCTGLADITIPDSVTVIWEFAFGHCTGLTNVTILNPECRIAGSMLAEFDYTGTITGYENSTAQAFAEECSYTFSALGQETIPYPTGDIDGDGEINAVDASLLLMAAALTGTGQPSGLTPEQEAAADVDGQDGFNAVDASYILQYAAYMGNNPEADLHINDFIAGL